MPPQNQPNQPSLTPEDNEGIKRPEVHRDQKPETRPEVAPMPKTLEKPNTEQFADQTTQTQVPSVPKIPAPDQPVQTVPTQVPVTEDEEAAAGIADMDKAWIDAVDTTIKNDEDKPYEEEEDSEKLQIDYLSKRFGKKVDKE